MEAAVLRLGGLLEAAPVGAVEPAVVEAAQAAVLQPPEGQVDAAVRAEAADQPPAAVAAEQDQVLAEQPHRLDRTLRRHLGHERRRLPVGAHQPAQRRVRPGPRDALVVRLLEHPRPRAS